MWITEELTSYEKSDKGKKYRFFLHADHRKIDILGKEYQGEHKEWGDFHHTCIEKWRVINKAL